MSDTDSDSSTDSDNNNSSPFFNHYFGHPHGYEYEHDIDFIESPRIEIYQASIDDSSDSDVFPNLYHDSTSSAVSFQNLSLIYFIFILFYHFRVKHY